ncbi:uncharacterized protein LOC143280828 [Babylonia areolata]|uniref:uncharacterized protein LOC143280828 n=1 Tax=Babylonia areolata TaxID=304850 RepID=UPI003FD5E858
MSHYMKSAKKTFSKNTQDSVIRPLLRQRDTGELCDIELKLNGRKFYAHKAILALGSPYFLSMFTCDMREKSTREVDLSASLSVENDDVLARVLDFMYTGSILLTTDNVVEIISVSDFLLIDDLKDYCKQFLLDLGNLDLTNCLRVRFLADDHNLPEVADAAQHIIEARFHDYLIHHDEVLDLPPDCLLRLLKIPSVVQHTSYIELKKVVNRWVDNDPATRQTYFSCLIDCVKSWISDYANEASYLGRELRRSLEGADASLAFHLEPSNVCDNANLIASVSNSCSGMLSPDKTETPVLFAAVCNQGLKFMKVMVYSLSLQKWFHFPISGERLLQFIPARQTVCSMLVNDARLYMYLCYSFPYPTDMLKINILVVDLITGQPSLFSFRTADNYNPCYRTTLTSHRTVPAAMVLCSGQLVVVGNKEGTGHLFLCKLNTNQYSCFQIPGSRFISLARCVVRENRNVFIWFRHRTGPSEEFCVKKSVGFAVFDIKSKIFRSLDMTAPDISYDDFARCYTLCLRDDTVHIYHPGDPALVLDEVRGKWITSVRRLPSAGGETPSESEGQAYGYKVITSTEDSVFVFDNEQPYSTSLHEISEKFPCAMAHIPPPIDNISVVAPGNIPVSVLQSLSPCSKYDDAYANALHVTLQSSDGETDDSASACEDQNTDNDEYEYDDDIYDYDFGYNIEGLDF